MRDLPKELKRTSREDAFIEILFGEDELGVVVRAHIHIEARLNDFLDVVVPFPEQLPRLRYEQRARLACALGLREDSFPSLKLLGDIRNRFGHKLDTKLTVAIVDELYSALPEDDRDTMREAHKMTKQSHPEVTAEFAALGPKDKFILVAITLDRILAFAHYEALQRRRTGSPGSAPGTA